jgi:hypothetical protein
VMLGGYGLCVCQTPDQRQRNIPTRCFDLFRTCCWR